VFDQIGIGALHNMTDIPFLTSRQSGDLVRSVCSRSRDAALRAASWRTNCSVIPRGSEFDDLWPFIDA
jgi:hypothetical protein